MVGSARRSTQRWIAGVVVTVLATALPVLGAPAALADSAPTPPTPRTVTADALPTVQINGVVWDQVIVGSRVYVTGNFSQARPAGAAAGTNQTARANLLAYDLATGALVTSWAPTLNGQGLAIDASADGTRIYVAGEFTQVNGTTRGRVAALDATTGTLVTSFNPNANSRVRALEVDGGTVYMGGNFSTVGGQTRNRVAAVSGTTGALTPWAPVLDAEVYSVVAPAGSGTVVAGGRFEFANGQQVKGLASFNASDAALRPWQAYGVFPNFGPDSAIYSLATDGNQVYGTAYDFFGPSPFEGTFAVAVGDGRVNWVTGCLGDTYDVMPIGQVVYNVSHAHNCAPIGGNPEINPRSYQYAQALTAAPAADGRVNNGGAYGGVPAPELLHWLPTLNAGTFTGQSQAGWTLTGNSEWLVVGGEFPRVNGTNQQGLTRFRINGPNTQAPLGYAELKPSIVSLAPGAARVAWTAAWDRDNRTLTYEVLRGATLGGSTVVGTVTADSAWWDRRPLAFTDTTVAPGSTQTYRIRAKDVFGNQLISETTQVTVAAGIAQPSPYGDAVRADAPSDYWRLGEPDGATAYDWVGGADLTVDTSATRGTPGPLTEANPATTFTGSATVPATSTAFQPGPQTFAVEAWFRTTTTSGGKIVGFGNSTTGDSSGYDRHVYMTNDGRVVFGVYPGAIRTLTTATPLNDGQWHHVVGSVGPAGMELFVDGRRAGRRTDTTTAQPYSGVWRIGGDNLNAWVDQPSSSRFAGAVDEVAVYPSALSLERAQAHYAASGRQVQTGVRPTDAYGAAVYDASPDSYWRLGETSGTTAADVTVNGANGLYAGGTVLGAPGVVGTTGVQLDGIDDVVAGTQQVDNPTVYSQELWFSTTTTRGGRLIGFGREQTGSSGSYDRHVYMLDDGRLRFGAYNGTLNLADTTVPFNDGQWHHMVASQGADGMKLYVDGVLAASNPNTQAENYAGYWRVGGDNTWGGASSNYFSGRIDEVAVYPTVLTPEQVTDHYLKGGGTAPNAVPTASFAATPNGLAVAFDGSASADTDGTITGYAWDFGDTTSGTGPSPSHTYTAAGTYTVRLTVTDDDTATGTTTRTVTVTAPPPNAVPTASFTATPNGLTVAFDGSASADTDGTITGYAWDFGDTTSGTGPSPSHTYTAAGTYTVRLTVTDDDTATGTTTRTVTVTAPVVPTTYATDAFGRSVTGGLGTADTGGSWTTSGGAAAFSVSGGAALVQAPTAGAQRTAYLGGVAQTDTDVAVSVSLDKVQTGGGTYVSVLGRRVGTTGDYRVKLRYLATGAVTAQLVRTVGTTETVLSSATVPGLTYAPGEVLRIRLQVGGAGTTALAARVWRAEQTEPTAWLTTANDTTAALQAPGSVGLVNYLSASSTNAPLTARFDDLVAGPRPVG